MKTFRNKTFRNMVIAGVENCSEHAKERVGRILEAVYVQDDGEILMIYKKQPNTDYQAYFRLKNISTKKKLFSDKVVMVTATGTYVLRTASETDINEARSREAFRNASQLVRQVYGDSVSYMAPERIVMLAEQIRTGQLDCEV